MEGQDLPAGLQQGPAEDLVTVGVEACVDAVQRPGAGQIGGRPQVAPVAHHVVLHEILVLFVNGHRPGPGPAADREGLQGIHEAIGVRLGGFVAAADAGAAPDQTAEAGASLGQAFQPQGAVAEALRVGDFLEFREGGRAGVEESVQGRLAREIHLLRVDDLWPTPAVQPQRAEPALAPQALVQQWMALLDPAGLEQQRADFACRPLPADAFGAPQQTAFRRVAQVGQHAAAVPIRQGPRNANRARAGADDRHALAEAGHKFTRGTGAVAAEKVFATA